MRVLSGCDNDLMMKGGDTMNDTPNEKLCTCAYEVTPICCPRHGALPGGELNPIAPYEEEA